MRKTLPVILFIFSFCFKISGQVTVESLLQRSKAYYFSLQKFSITWDEKFKNAIDIDTHYLKETHYIDNVRRVKFFKGSGYSLIKINADQYWISNNSFTELQERKSKYRETYRYYPYTEPKLFFENAGQSIPNRAKITESDSTYSVSFKTNGIKTLEFRKNDYSIRCITEVLYDRLNKGFQTKQITFGQAQVLIKPDEDLMDNAIAIIIDPSKKAVYVKQEHPKIIDRSLIESTLKYLTNGRVPGIENKIVFLDFFYQSCYPCVKSYPYVSDLFKNKNPDVILIGVDVVLTDSLTIGKYSEKYNLQYPILAGETAVTFERYFKFNGAPYFVIVAPDGKLRYEYGFTKSSFRKFTKELSIK